MAERGIIPTTATGEEEDRISALPDGIIHEIIGRIGSPKQEAQVSILSKRWTKLWLSYPVLKFDEEEFQEGADEETLRSFDAAICKKFVGSGSTCLRLKSIDVFVNRFHDRKFYSDFLDNIFNLALKFSPQEIDIAAYDRYPGNEDLEPYSIPGGFFSHRNQFAGLRVLQLSYCSFRSYADLSSNHNPNPFAGLGSCLKVLSLESVNFPNDQLLIDMIHGAALLETLILVDIKGIQSLQVLNHPNLKLLEATHLELKDLYVAVAGVPSLEILRLHSFYVYSEVLRIQVTAPNVRVLEIGGQGLTMADIQAVVSKLPSLKSLTLRRIRDGKKLNLSIPKLEEFKMWEPERRSEEIELDAGPNLAKFGLVFPAPIYLIPSKIEIMNAPACQWEADFTLDIMDGTEAHPWFVRLKSILERFIHFRNVNIDCLGRTLARVIFKEQEVDHVPHPRTVEHLKLETGFSSRSGVKAFFNGLFWACRPLRITVIYRERYNCSDPKGPLEVISDMISEFSDEALEKDDEQRPNEHQSWKRQLKGVKIMKPNADGTWEEQGLMNISDDDLVALLATQKRVCFMLMWN